MTDLICRHCGQHHETGGEALACDERQRVPRGTEIPERMQRLPLDPARRVPVPWFVPWVDGKPDFRLMTMDRMLKAIHRELCWVCGERMGRIRAFVIGPMCSVNRVAPEPPSHRDCAVYSARSCPFLSNPRSIRRETNLPEPDRLGAPAGISIRRNPGVTLVWLTKRYRIESEPNGFLFRLGDPMKALWFAESRPATRAEVLASIESGLPQLAGIAEAESPAAVAELERMRQVAMQWVPAR